MAPNRRPITTEGNNAGPAWSPDGSRIAFHSDRAGSLDIYTMAADGTDVRRVTTEPSSDFGADLVAGREADRIRVRPRWRDGHLCGRRGRDRGRPAHPERRRGPGLVAGWVADRVLVRRRGRRPGRLHDGGRRERCPAADRCRRQQRPAGLVAGRIVDRVRDRPRRRPRGVRDARRRHRPAEPHPERRASATAGSDRRGRPTGARSSTPARARSRTRRPRTAARHSGPRAS